MQRPAEGEAMATGGPDSCLVTGASGYIASHVVQQLLLRGDVRVRGTVRDLKSQKAEKLSKFVPDAKYPLELVEAQLQNADSWIEAVKGCCQVYHIASPVQLTPRDENEVIAPAVEGTLNVLKACAEAGTVKRVVLTSSIAAVSNNLNGDTGRTYTEEDWSIEERCGPYEKSKLRAEKAAWEFVKKLEDDKKFELVVINPAVVFGPYAFPGDSYTVNIIIRDILIGKYPALPHVNLPSVDVRDVARAHVAAMEKPEAAGKRFILYNKSIWVRDVAELISAEFAPMGYKIPLRNFPKFLMWALKWFDAETKMMYQWVDKDFTYNTTNAKEILGIETPVDLNKTILDTCYDLIEREIVPRTSEYKSRTSSEAAALPSVEAAEPAEKSEQAEEAEQVKKPEQTSGKEQPKEAAESTEKAEPDSVQSKEQATKEPSEPEPAKQVTQEPSEPESAEQATKEPSEPEPAEQATKEPSEPKLAEQVTKEPEPAEQATKEPETAEQATKEPSELEPAVQDKTSEPEPAEQEPSEPEPAEQEPSEPEPPEQDKPSQPAEPAEQEPSEPEPAESKENTEDNDKEQPATEQENQ